MLNEMDGFDVAEGIVVMAATNRPYILDPGGRPVSTATLVSPPDLDERLPILQVHCKDKRMVPDLDLSIIAQEPRACPAPTWPISSTRPRCTR